MTKQTEYTVEEVSDVDNTIYYYVHSPEFHTIPQAEKLRQQLLENQEKAEKYDSLMNANHEIVKNNILHTQIYQENKALKEKIKELEKLQ